MAWLSLLFAMQGSWRIAAIVAALLPTSLFLYVLNAALRYLAKPWTAEITGPLINEFPTACEKAGVHYC